MAYTTIDNPALFFNTITYSGNGSNPRTLTGVGFQPDWVWQKNRTDSNGHTLADAVRGANKTVSADGSGAEVTDKSDGHLDAFTSDGFTVGAGSSSDARVNDGSHTYVAWNWLAGNGTASNGNGSITSTVSVNTTAGFSIVSYAGTGSAATVGHGLGVAPRLIIIKNRSSSESWRVYHGGLGATKEIYLDLTSAAGTSSSSFNDTEPTSSVFSVGTGNGTNKSSDNLIAYCFAEKQGYSKFSTYEGNGSTDGTFVYTGFKPALIIIKNTTSGHNWLMFDNKRDIDNPVSQLLMPNQSSAEQTMGTSNPLFDFCSNGFKLRGTGTDGNESGSTHIYMAFAESPFVTEGTKAAGTAR